MGGVYGNVPAFRRCIEDANEQGCDLFVFLGDVIGCSGHSDEVISMAEEHFDVCVSGNLEQQAAAGETGCGCGYDSEEEQRISSLAFEYALSSLSEGHRDRIDRWPDRVIVDTRGGAMICCHGSPDRTNEFLYESTTTPDDLQDWMKEFHARALACSHTGLPWIKTGSIGEERWTAVNCGAVGKPDHDGDPAVHYAILPVRNDQYGPPEIRRVEYDYEDWCRILEEEGVDDLFIDPLRTGIWTNGIQNLPEAERQRHEERPQD